MWSVFRPISTLGQHKSALLAPRWYCAVSIWLMLTLPPQTGVKWLSPLHSWEGYKAACKILTQPSTWLTAQQQHSHAEKWSLNSMIWVSLCIHTVCTVCFQPLNTFKPEWKMAHYFYKCQHEVKYAFNFHNVVMTETNLGHLIVAIGNYWAMILTIISVTEL